MSQNRGKITETIIEEEMFSLPTPRDKKSKDRAAEVDATEATKLQKELLENLCTKEDRQKESLNHFVLLKYLVRWHHSVYGLIWIDVLCWIVLYTALNVAYRQLMDVNQRAVFIRLVLSLKSWQLGMPITFLLGFFVSNVVNRWWQLYLTVPTMSKVCTAVCAYLSRGDASKVLKYRLIIARYLNLAFVIKFWSLSAKLNMRFQLLRELVAEFNKSHTDQKENTYSTGPSPNTQHHSAVNNNLNLLNFDHVINQQVYPALRSIGASANHRSVYRRHNLSDSKTATATDAATDAAVDLLTENLVLLNQDPVVSSTFGELVTPSEINAFQASVRDGHCTSLAYELPIHWAIAAAAAAVADGVCDDEEGFTKIVECVQSWRSGLSTCAKFAKRALPLVYAQVVIIAVYTWYFTEILSSQMLDIADFKAENITDEVMLKVVKVPSANYIDYYVPLLALLRAVFIMGWFKVAMVVLDPFGTDKEDLPISHIFTDNLKCAIRFSHCATHYVPKKLLPAAVASSNCLQSDSDDTEELIKEKRGPWRQSRATMLE